MLSTPIDADAECVLAIERDRTYGTFDGVEAAFDESVVEEACDAIPA